MSKPKSVERSRTKRPPQWERSSQIELRRREGIAACPRSSRRQLSESEERVCHDKVHEMKMYLDESVYVVLLRGRAVMADPLF
jgi:hypothetical protein